MSTSFNPNREKDIARLRSAVSHSRKKLEVFRIKREGFIRQYVGGNYSDDGAPDAVPINLMEMAINIYSRQLMADNPRVMVNTEQMNMKPQAVAMELSLNQQIIAINLRRSLRAWVMDAMFGMGIMVCQEDEQGAYAEPIDLSNWVHDMTCTDFRAISFAGHEYTVPLYLARENEQFGLEERESLRATHRTDHHDGDDGDALDIREISLGEEGDSGDEFEDKIALWDFYLPAQNLILTCPANNYKSVLRIRDWVGPVEGPYHYLRYEEVPGQIMPLPLASLAMDLHLLGNEIFLKLADQAERQKTITIVRDNSQSDGERIRLASDGETIISSDPSAAKEMRYGGIAQENLAFFMQVRQLFSYLLGNLDSLGGLGAQSETLGQDKMLAEAASRRISDMQEATVEATQGVVKALAWYEWHDPFLNKQLKRPIPDFPGLSTDVSLVAENLMGEFPDYLIEIDPYSLRDKTPGTELQVLGTVMQQYIGPFMEPMTQQGMTIDFQQLLKLVAKRTGFTDLEEIIMWGGADETPQGSERPASKTTQTHRINERINTPGGTRNGQEAALSQVLLGGRPQDAEMDAISRPVT